MNTDTIFKGPFGSRSPNGTSIIEFKTRVDRDAFFKFTRDNSKKMTDARGAQIDMDRAQLQAQMQRNKSLKMAKSLIEKHPGAHGKNVTINWMLEESVIQSDNSLKKKDRTISIDGIHVFVQSLSDSHGLFKSQFVCIFRKPGGDIT